jgi:hypothetical protein
LSEFVVVAAAAALEGLAIRFLGERCSLAGSRSDLAIRSVLAQEAVGAIECSGVAALVPADAVVVQVFLELVEATLVTVDEISCFIQFCCRFLDFVLLGSFMGYGFRVVALDALWVGFGAERSLQNMWLFLPRSFGLSSPLTFKLRRTYFPTNSQPVFPHKNAEYAIRL